MQSANYSYLQTFWQMDLTWKDRRHTGVNFIGRIRCLHNAEKVCIFSLETVGNIQMLH